MAKNGDISDLARFLRDVDKHLQSLLGLVQGLGKKSDASETKSSARADKIERKVEALAKQQETTEKKLQKQEDIGKEILKFLGDIGKVGLQTAALPVSAGKFLWDWNDNEVSQAVGELRRGRAFPHRSSCGDEAASSAKGTQYRRDFARDEEWLTANRH